MIELTYLPGGETVTLPDGRTARGEFAAARQLLADGTDPATRIQTRWPNSPHPSLSGTVGGWAKLSVDETRMGFVPYRPFPVQR